MKSFSTLPKTFVLCLNETIKFSEIYSSFTSTRLFYSNYVKHVVFPHSYSHFFILTFSLQLTHTAGFFYSTAIFKLEVRSTMMLFFLFHITYIYLFSLLLLLFHSKPEFFIFQVEKYNNLHFTSFPFIFMRSIAGRRENFYVIKNKSERESFLKSREKSRKVKGKVGKKRTQ
jgi:hypothetical protein